LIAGLSPREPAGQAGAPRDGTKPGDVCVWSGEDGLLWRVRGRL